MTGTTGGLSEALILALMTACTDDFQCLFICVYFCKRAGFAMSKHQHHLVVLAAISENIVLTVFLIKKSGKASVPVTEVAYLSVEIAEYSSLFCFCATDQMTVCTKATSFSNNDCVPTCS